MTDSEDLQKSAGASSPDTAAPEHGDMMHQRDPHESVTDRIDLVLPSLLGPGGACLECDSIPAFTPLLEPLGCERCYCGCHQFFCDPCLRRLPRLRGVTAVRSLMSDSDDTTNPTSGASSPDTDDLNELAEWDRAQRMDLISGTRTFSPDFKLDQMD